jgi:hypothetical protein
MSPQMTAKVLLISSMVVTACAPRLAVLFMAL